MAADVAATVALGYFAVLWWQAFRDAGLQDAHVYLRAGRDVVQGVGVYEPRAALPYTYPPLWALLCAPLGWLPPTTALVVFGLTSVALCWWVLRRLAPGGPRAWVWVGFAVLSAPIGRSLYLGQVNPWIVALLVADVAVLPVALRGVGTGLAAAIKVTPAFLALTFLVDRDGKSVARCVGTFALATAIGFLALPDASRQFWGSLLWESSRVGDLAYPDNQSLQGLASRLLEPGPATVLARLAGVVVLIVCWRAVAVQQRGGSGLAALAAAGIGSVLVSPVSWSHHWIWLVVLSALVWRAGRRAWSLALLAPLVASPLWLADGLLAQVALPGPLEALLLSLPTLTGIVALAALARQPAPGSSRGSDGAASGIPVRAG